MLDDFRQLSISLAAIVGGLILSWLLGIVTKQANKRFLSRTSTQIDNIIIEAIILPLRLAIIVLGFQLAANQLKSALVSWEQTLNEIFFVVYLLLVYVALYRLIGGISKWYAVEVVGKTETELDDKFLSFFRALAYVILSATVIIILLSHFGIEPSALVTTLGIGTLAVALAAQETLSDMISGFMIMIDQPFTVGQRIAITDIDTWGDVTEIGLRSTRILTRDNRLVSIPNSVIGKGLVVNYSDPSTVFRVQTHIGVAYGTDINKARQVMVEAIKKEEWVMLDRPVEALMLEFGESAMNFRVRCWIEHFVEMRRVIDKMNTALYVALKEAGIDLEPQLSVKTYQSTIAAEKASGLGKRTLSQ